MSLIGKIFKTAKGALTGFVTGGPLGAVAGGMAGLAAGKSNLNRSRAALPTTETFSASDLVRAGSGAVSMLPAVVRTGVGAVARRVPAIAAGAAVGQVVVDMYGRVVGNGARKRRRMNPMNARAARRAIRRIKGARKMLQQIERQLPKQRAAAPRRSFGRNSETQFIRQG
jgi:hypothetical protein